MNRHIARLGLAAAILSAVSTPAFAATAPTKPTGDKPTINDHWHVAYGIWNCGKWEPNLPVGEDPLGIHTHGDGIIHIHPFVPEAAGKNATMAAFFKTEKIAITSSAITLPGKTLKTGADCKGKKAVVRTLLWKSKTTTTPEVLKGDPAKLAFKNNGIVAFVFDAEDAKISQPPSVPELEDLADVAPPALTTEQLQSLPAVPSPVPTPTMKGTPPTTLTTTDLQVGTGAEIKNGQRPYIRYTLYLWRTAAQLDTSDWSAIKQPVAINKLGKKRNLAGIDKGLVGMKVGGVRQIIVPPSEGFGAAGSPPILGTDTLVMVAQLVSISSK